MQAKYCAMSEGVLFKSANKGKGKTAKAACYMNIVYDWYSATSKYVIWAGKFAINRVCYLPNLRIIKKCFIYV